MSKGRPDELQIQHEVSLRTFEPGVIFVVIYFHTHKKGVFVVYIFE